MLGIVGDSFPEMVGGGCVGVWGVGGGDFLGLAQMRSERRFLGRTGNEPGVRTRRSQMRA